MSPKNTIEELENTAHDRNHDNCFKAMRAVQDSLYVLTGKWKLPIIVSLTFGNKRFNEIARDIPNITDRMLAKELRELELNEIVERVDRSSSPTIIEYALTRHGKTLDPAIQELFKWGIKHQKQIQGVSFTNNIFTVN